MENRQTTQVAVTVGLPADVWNRIVAIAEARGMTPAQVLARLAVDFFGTDACAPDESGRLGVEGEQGDSISVYSVYFDCCGSSSLGSPI